MVSNTDGGPVVNMGEKNDVVFNDVKWHPSKLIQNIWLGILDYDRVEWATACHSRKT